MSKDEIICMARDAGMDIDDEASGFGAIITAEPLDLERFATLVAAHERKKISETFWAALNFCITSDELGVEFMQKFYQLHIFGHWLDREKK